MEICDASLGDLIEQREELAAGPLEPMKIRKVCLDVCSALDYLHTKAFLLHGDLKSYNVLIKNSFEHCKLCDFGVSLPLNNDGYIDLMKDPKAKYIGTNIYSAPEIFRAPLQDISNKCDIFSFGLIIFECLTLKVPHYEHFEASNMSSICSDLDSSNASKMNRQIKKLFDDSIESKENHLSISTLAGMKSKETTFNDSQIENSVLIKSTAATIGDDTIQDITTTTFNESINSENNKNITNSDISFDNNASINRPPMRDVSTTLNSSAFDSESESSLIDKSQQSFDETDEQIETWFGTRPRIPDIHIFSEDYNVYFETFYMCTHALPEERPTAGDLLKSMEAVKPHY